MNPIVVIKRANGNRVVIDLRQVHCVAECGPTGDPNEDVEVSFLNGFQLYLNEKPGDILIDAYERWGAYISKGTVEVKEK